MDRLWTSVLVLNQEFQYGHSEKISAKDTMFDLARFISHCCKLRHYFLDILKCGKSNCTIRLPIRLPSTEFQKLDHLLDPVPGTEGHYKPFTDMFKTKTTKEHQPSKCAKPQKEKSLPFYTSVQHVRNMEVMLMCDKCGMWHLLYSKRKLNPQEQQELEQSLDGMSFSCEAQLQDCERVPPYLKEVVFVRKMSCEDPLKNWYYSARFEDICIYSSSSVPPWRERDPFYLQCSSCGDRPKILNAKKEKSSRDWTLFKFLSQVERWWIEMILIDDNDIHNNE